MNVEDTLKRLQDNLPNCYAKGANGTLTKLLRAVAVGLAPLEEDVQDFVDDTFSQTADGEGAHRLARNYGIKRPPQVPDSQLMLLVRTLNGANRGTLAAIKSVIEAATGLAGVGAFDKQQPGSFLSIPSNEIWITVPNDMGGMGFWWGYDTHFSAAGEPLESGIWGPVYDEEGEFGALYNDHFYAPLHPDIIELADSVRLAGTIIIYKPVLP